MTDRLPPDDLPQAVAELKTIDAVEDATWQRELRPPRRSLRLVGFGLLVAMTWSYARFGGVDGTPWWFLVTACAAVALFVGGVHWTQQRRADVLRAT